MDDHEDIAAGPTRAGTSPMYVELERASVVELERFSRQMKRAKNKMRWHLLGQRRASRVAQLLHVLQLALEGDRVRRARCGRVWRFFTDTKMEKNILVLELHVHPVMGVEDFRVPLRLTVHRADLVDVAALRHRMPDVEVVVR